MDYQLEYNYIVDALNELRLREEKLCYSISNKLYSDKSGRKRLIADESEISVKAIETQNSLNALIEEIRERGLILDATSHKVMVYAVEFDNSFHIISEPDPNYGGEGSISRMMAEKSFLVQSSDSKLYPVKELAMEMV